MSKLSVYIPILSVLLLSATSLSAQEPFFYDGTRPLSTGKAFIALADDENALLYNPAGLTRIEGNRITLSGYIQQYSWDLTAYPLEGFMSPNFTDRGFTVSYVRQRFGISYSNTGKGWWNTMEMGFRDIDDPETTYRTVRPVNYERYLTACYAHEVNSWISLGITGKYLHFASYSDMEIYDDTNGVTFDIGLLVDPLDRLSFGLNLQNTVSSKVDYVIYNDYSSIAFLSELPVNLSIGIAWLPIDALTILADVRNLTQDDVSSDLSDVMLEFKRSWHIGCEWRPVGGLSIRAGYYYCERPAQRAYPAVPFDASGSNYYEYENYNNLTLGAGYLYRGISFDLGVKIDDRKSKLNESTTSQVRDNTAMGSASLSYSF